MIVPTSSAELKQLNNQEQEFSTRKAGKKANTSMTDTTLTPIYPFESHESCVKFPEKSICYPECLIMNVKVTEIIL